MSTTTNRQVLLNDLPALCKARSPFASRIARDLGIRPSTLREIAIGRRKPSADMIAKISNYFGVNVGEVFFTEDYPPKHKAQTEEVAA